MKKFLVVGVGGSGGATLRYLMDQLRADLRERGVEQMPDAWQFLQIDVNPTPESTAGLGSIVDLGGRYVPVGSTANQFGDIRRTVETRLAARGALGSLATWCPGEDADANPVVTGAGQFRAIGRMLTLTRVREIESAMQQAWEALQRPTSWGALPERFGDQTPFDHAGVVVPIVVGSVAGGSGASMFLDVCRLLGRVGSLDRTLLGAFLYSPDVFSSLDDAKTKGIDGNALGALGELIAAQTGAADTLDSELLSALGIPAERTGEAPFGRVFPIGSFIGGDGARFGATHDHIYRGLGRALAATMLSESATAQYLQTRFENPPPLDDSQTRFGWGATGSVFAWASFGYASLSLGRDRYSEYVAQRLARTAVDQLLDGYSDPTSQLAPTEQVEQIVDTHWNVVVERLGLAGPGASVREWLVGTALPESQRAPMVAAATGPFLRWTQQIGRMAASEWLTEVRINLANHEDIARAVVREHTYTWAVDYATALEERTTRELVRILASPGQGLPVARKVLDRLRAEVGRTVEALGRARENASSVLEVSLDTETVAARLGDTVSAVAELQRLVDSDLAASADRQVAVEAAKLVAGILTSYTGDVLEGLSTSVDLALENLDAARTATERKAGIALLRSTAYRDWPEDSDLVPTRFDEAENEVLLTTSAEFPAKFREHLAASPGGGTTQDKALGMVSEIVGGSWDNVGAQRARFPVVQGERSWRAPILNKDAQGEPVSPSRPAYRLALSTRELLERALAYAGRKDQQFERFSSETFEGYLNEEGLSEAVHQQRRADFVQKFEETTAQAHPLVEVSRRMISTLHHANLTVELTFSAIPLTPGSAVVQAVQQKLIDSADIEPQTVTRFQGALQPASPNSRIAVFGGYPVYNPLVFSSFLRQLNDRWLRESDAGQRSLWKWKRTRPIPGAVAMSPVEQLTLVKAWYLGRALGLVHQPADNRSSDPVNVWSGSGRDWVTFEPRLLTARDRYRDPDGFDWLAGILEGHTLAVVRSVDDPELRALRPYEALRHLLDDGPQPATTATITRGHQLVENWLRTGVWPSGEPSSIDSLAGAAPDHESRAQAFLDWLASVRRWIADQWLEQTSGFGPSAGYRLRVPTADETRTLPLFVEIALLTYHALGELEVLVEQAKVNVVREGTGGAAPQV